MFVQNEVAQSHKMFENLFEYLVYKLMSFEQKGNSFRLQSIAFVFNIINLVFII